MHAWARTSRKISHKIGNISSICCRFFQNIDRAYDFLTNNLTAQIRTYFDPTIQLSSAFKKHPTAIFFIQRLILNLKLDLTVHNDYQQIYNDPTIRFKPKSNPTVRIKSLRFFDNPMIILTPKNFINTSKIIQFHYELIHTHQSSI